VCLGAKFFFCIIFFSEKRNFQLGNADAVDTDLARVAVFAGSALDGVAVLVDANMVCWAVSVSVAVDLDTFLVLAVSWHVRWAVGSDETLGAVDARVLLAVRGWSTLGEVLAVSVRSASDINALVVSAERSSRWPAAVVVGSAFLLYAFVSKAEALAITAFCWNIGFARSMSDTLWREASVRGLVAELIISTVADVGTFDVDTFLLDALVSFKTGVLEEIGAVFVVSAFLLNTHGRFAKFFVAAVGLVSTIDFHAFVVDAVLLRSAVLVALALDIDAGVWLTFLWCFSGADLAITAVIGVSALDRNTLVRCTSALAISASRGRGVQAVVVRSAVDSFTCILDASLLVSAVVISSALLGNTLVRCAETVAFFASGNALVEAHGVTSALDFFAGVGFSVAELASTAVVVVSAFLSLTRVLEALPVVVVGIYAVLVRVAVDFFTDVVLADSVVVTVLVAVRVVITLDWKTGILFADVSVFISEVEAVFVRQAIDIEASVSAFFTSTDLFVTAVFSGSAFDVNANVSDAGLLATAVIVSGTVDRLARITVTSLFEAAMIVGSALLSLALVVLAEAVSFRAVVSEDGLSQTVARRVTDALDILALAADLVALSDAVVDCAVIVDGTFSIDTLVLDTSLLLSASGVSDASDLDALIVLADFAVRSIAVAVFGADLINANVVFAKLSIAAERVASAINHFACVVGSIANFGNRGIAVAFSSALDGSAFRKTVLSALGGGAVGEALGWFESTVVVWDGFLAVRVSRALSIQTHVVVASLFISAMIGGDAFLRNALVLFASTLAFLTNWVGMALASLVANAVDGLAGVLSRILLVWSVAKEVAGAISVGSALSSNTGVIDADSLGAALIVLVASNSVAGVREVSSALIVTSPGVLTVLALAVAVGSALD